MLVFNQEKVYSSYLILSNDFNRSLNAIFDFTKQLGFNQELVDSKNHPDIFVLESIDKNISVESIREQIVTPSYYKPSLADRKFYVIYDASNLNSSSQNTLLKTLEESSNFVTFFLITKNDSALLDTIKSRCIKLVDIDDDLSIKYLSECSYFDDAIDLICNLHYKNIVDISNFLNNVITSDKNSIYNLIHIFIYFIKDVIIYKKTYDDNYISLKNKKVEITSSTHFSFKFLGDLLDNFYELLPYMNNNSTNSYFSYNILSDKDKSFMIYNLLIDKKKELQYGNNKMYRR